MSGSADRYPCAPFFNPSPPPFFPKPPPLAVSQGSFGRCHVSEATPEPRSHLLPFVFLSSPLSPPFVPKFHTCSILEEAAYCDKVLPQLPSHCRLFFRLQCRLTFPTLIFPGTRGRGRGAASGAFLCPRLSFPSDSDAFSLCVFCRACRVPVCYVCRKRLEPHLKKNKKTNSMNTI